MSAIEKLREIAGQKASPSCRFALTAADCSDLLQEIDRMRAHVEATERERDSLRNAEFKRRSESRFWSWALSLRRALLEANRRRRSMREACARICDERAAMFSGDHFPIRTEEATNCAAAIRAGGKP